MNRVLLVPDLALEGWLSVDRYATELARRIPGVEQPTALRAMGGPRHWARYVRYPRALRRHHPDLVHIADHSYGHCLSAFPGVPSVVTIHDLFPLHVIRQGAHSVRQAVRIQALSWVLSWLKRATAWIAVSEFTAGEARRELGLPADRVHVVPNGVAESFFARPTAAAIAKRRRGWLGADGARGRFVVLHVGRCEPRKNVEAAIQALGILRRRGVEAVLVQVGGRLESSHRRAATTSGVEAIVIEEGAVAETALVEAYYAADALVFPSTYEGFGLPVLEAQAAGLPVVISDAPALVEAAGGCSLVAGREPAALAESLARVLTDAGTRTTLILRGLRYARTMTWDRTAAKTQRVYADLLPLVRLGSTGPES